MALNCCSGAGTTGLVCFGCVCNRSLTFSLGLAGGEAVTRWPMYERILHVQILSFFRVINEIGNEFFILWDTTGELSFFLAVAQDPGATLKNIKELTSNSSN